MVNEATEILMDCEQIRAEAEKRSVSDEQLVVVDKEIHARYLACYSR